MSNQTLGKRIAELRKKRGLTQTQLGERIGKSHSLVASWETGKRDPHSSMITKLADFFNVSTDYLIGQSISALIENRIEELSMTLEELSEKTKIPLSNLQNLDNSYPEPWDYEPNGTIDRLSKALNMDSKKLTMAYARQEPLGYEGPSSSTEEDFGEIEFKKSISTLNTKDERDIARELEQLMSSLDSDNALAFDGEPLTEEDRELLRASLEHSLRTARIVARQKFTPKKFKK